MKGTYHGGKLPTGRAADFRGHYTFLPSGRGAMMNTVPAGEITTLLHAWSDGDDRALAQLTPLVFRELYHSAQRCMAHQRPGHLLQNTALVNEVYIRLARLGVVTWRDRTHFYAFCAQSMRHILVDYARAQLYDKRGGDAQRVVFNEAMAVSYRPSADLLALNDALEKLATFDKRKSRVVELRYFGGLSVRETAEVLNISEDTVGRDWSFAKHWLLSEIRGVSHRAK